METNVNFEPGCATIQLAGRFDFYAHRDFRQASDTALERSNVQRIQIDLGRVEFMAAPPGHDADAARRARPAKRSDVVNCMRNVPRCSTSPISQAVPIT